MKKIYLLFVFISLLNADINIKDAWQKVLHVNESIKASSSEVDRARLLKESAKSMYLPEISLDGTYTRLSQKLDMNIDIDLSPLG